MDPIEPFDATLPLRERGFASCRGETGIGGDGDSWGVDSGVVAVSGRPPDEASARLFGSGSADWSASVMTGR
jgi:hypothetical protein